MVGRDFVGWIPRPAGGGVDGSGRAQPRSYNPVASTLSSLAAVGAVDRSLMTWALAGIGACYVMTGLALRPAASAGRLILMAVGVATIGVAANPEHAGHGGSLPHVFLAAIGFIVMAAWPARAGSAVPGRRTGCGPRLRSVPPQSCSACSCGLARS